MEALLAHRSAQLLRAGLGVVFCVMLNNGRSAKCAGAKSIADFVGQDIQTVTTVLSFLGFIGEQFQLVWSAMMQIGREPIRGEAQARLVSETAQSKNYVQDYMNGIGDSLLQQVRDYVDRRETKTRDEIAAKDQGHGAA